MIRSFCVSGSAALLLAGCVTAPATYGFPAPVGGGVYTAGTIAPGTAGYNDQNYQRSIRFCFEQGKQLVRVDPTGAPLTRRSPGEVLFRCAGPDEPGWQNPAG